MGVDVGSGGAERVVVNMGSGRAVFKGQRRTLQGLRRHRGQSFQFDVSRRCSCNSGLGVRGGYISNAEGSARVGGLHGGSGSG